MPQHSHFKNYIWEIKNSAPTLTAVDFHNCGDVFIIEVVSGKAFGWRKCCTIDKMEWGESGTLHWVFSNTWDKHSIFVFKYLCKFVSPYFLVFSHFGCMLRSHLCSKGALPWKLLVLKFLMCHTPFYIPLRLKLQFQLHIVSPKRKLRQIKIMINNSN